MREVFLSFLVVLGMCGKDETLHAYGAAGGDWTLQTIDGARFDARAIIRFPETGVVTGQAPCNSFRGQQTAPYPWFALEAVAATRRVCPDLPAETQFLTALQAMTVAEISGPTLILSTDDGREMVFTQSSP